MDKPYWAFLSLSEPWGDSLARAAVMDSERSVAEDVGVDDLVDGAGLGLVELADEVALEVVPEARSGLVQPRWGG